jgi:hypothetical protein
VLIGSSVAGAEVLYFIASINVNARVPFCHLLVLLPNIICFLNVSFLLLRARFESKGAMVRHQHQTTDASEQLRLLYNLALTTLTQRSKGRRYTLYFISTIISNSLTAAKRSSNVFQSNTSPGQPHGCHHGVAERRAH